MTNSLPRSLRVALAAVSFVAASTAASPAHAEDPVPLAVAGAKVIAKPVETAKKAGTRDQATTVAVLRFFGWTT